MSPVSDVASSHTDRASSAGPGPSRNPIRRISGSRAASSNAVIRARTWRGSMPGWSASSTSAASLEASSAQAFRERRRLPFRVAVVHSDASADRELDRVADAFGVVAHDHHDLLDARRRGGVDRVLDERLPAEPFDSLRGAEPLPSPAARTTAEITLRASRTAARRNA